MGVEFMICSACERTFPDCGPDASCYEDMGGCGQIFCSEECAQRRCPGFDRVPTWIEFEDLPEDTRNTLTINCIDCREELPSDRNILAFLLYRSNMTRAEANSAYLAESAAKKKKL